MAKCSFINCDCEIEPVVGKGRPSKYCLKHRVGIFERYSLVKEIAIKEGVIPPNPKCKKNYKFINQNPKPNYDVSKSAEFYSPRNSVTDILADIGECRITKSFGWKLLKGKVR